MEWSNGRKLQKARWIMEPWKFIYDTFKWHAHGRMLSTHDTSMFMFAAADTPAFYHHSSAHRPCFVTYYTYKLDILHSQSGYTDTGSPYVYIEREFTTPRSMLSGRRAQRIKKGNPSPLVWMWCSGREFCCHRNFV